ncbi:hypothetical protein CVT24_007144 [Panaeolus cyanescens]|uniref:G domain-containing protein n=1 Tax=Panaeolus cyanescens TaxID=181874 RepID=A0A409YPF8_9AGAR|nr:hypothetical protein CVT24_007144 [Panaeolus cyanescens]
MMQIEDHYKFVDIKITGPLKVVPVTPQHIEELRANIFILMGATGSGKSAFIESLSPNEQLSISNNTLESVTQEVIAYQIENLKRGQDPVILMDTPGFLDTRLSEGRILQMVMEKLNAFNHPRLVRKVRILWFQRITDIRMSGSGRRSVQLLRAFADKFRATGISIITTCWNTLQTPQKAEAANERLQSLRSDVYVSSREMRIKVLKFESTERSALLVLDTASALLGYAKDGSKTEHPQHQLLVSNCLLERIDNILQRLQYLAHEQHLIEAGESSELDNRAEVLAYATKQEHESLYLLQCFTYDLYEHDPYLFREHFPNATFPPPAPASTLALAQPQLSAFRQPLPPPTTHLSQIMDFSDLSLPQIATGSRLSLPSPPPRSDPASRHEDRDLMSSFNGITARIGKHFKTSK